MGLIAESRFGNQSKELHLYLLHDKLWNKHMHFFIEILESFEHEPAKKLKRFIFTLLEENVTYEQLKRDLKLE